MIPIVQMGKLRLRDVSWHSSSQRPDLRDQDQHRACVLGIWGRVRAVDTAMYRPAPAGFLTKVEVASLVLGLEEAAPGLSMDISPLGHEELHIMFAAALNGDVEGGLTWGGGGRTVTPGSCTAETRPSLKGVGAQCGNWVGAASQSLGQLHPKTAMDFHSVIVGCGISDAGSPRSASRILGSKGVCPTCRISDVGTFQNHKRFNPRGTMAS